MHATFVTNSETFQNNIRLSSCKLQVVLSTLVSDSTQNFPAVHHAQCIIDQLPL